MRTKKKNVMRTPEEKEAIVLEYLNDKRPSYRKTADKYGIAGSTFKKWKKAYLEFGIEGLKSQTGKAKHPGKGNRKRWSEFYSRFSCKNTDKTYSNT